MSVKIIEGVKGQYEENNDLLLNEIMELKLIIMDLNNKLEDKNKEGDK